MFWQANIFFTRDCLSKLSQWWSKLTIHLDDGTYIIIFSLREEMEGIFPRPLGPVFQYLTNFSNGEHFLAWTKTGWLVVLESHCLLGHRHFIKNDSMVNYVNPLPESWYTHNFFSLTRWEVSGIFLRPFWLVLGAKKAD